MPPADTSLRAGQSFGSAAVSAAFFPAASAPRPVLAADPILSSRAHVSRGLPRERGISPNAFHHQMVRRRGIPRPPRRAGKETRLAVSRVGLALLHRRNGE